MKKSNWTGVGLIYGLLIFGVVAALGYRAMREYSQNQGEINREAKRLAANRQSAASAGLALEIADLQTPERKQELARREAFLAFDDYVFARKDFWDALTLTDKMDSLQEVLSQYPDVFYIVEELALLEDVGTPIDWEAGLTSKFPDYRPYNRFATFCTRTAMFAFEEGDIGTALYRIELARKVASHLLNEPSTHSFAAWSSVYNRLNRALYSMLQSRPDDGDLIDRIIEVIEAFDGPVDFVGAIRGDVLLYLITARKFDEYDPEEQAELVMSSGSQRPVPTGKRLPEALESSTLAFWTEALAVLQPFEDDVRWQGVLLDSEGLQWMMQPRPSCFLAGAFPVTYEQLTIAMMRSMQMRRLVYTTAKVLQHRYRTGVLPTSIDDLGEWAVDPVEHAPFHYDPMDDAFVLQALGKELPTSVLPPRGPLALIEHQGHALRFELNR